MCNEKTSEFAEIINESILQGFSGDELNIEVVRQNKNIKEAQNNILKEAYLLEIDQKSFLDINNQCFKTRWNNFVKCGGTYDEKEINW